jgi:peroxiredoxin
MQLLSLVCLLLCSCGLVSSLQSPRFARAAQPSFSAKSSSATVTYDLLTDITVKDASTGASLPLTQAWRQRKGKKTVVAFCSHAADFNAFEYAQQLRHYLPAIDDAGADLVAVTIGTVEAAREFASITRFPLSNLYVDETGAAYKALGFSNGFEPPVKVCVCVTHLHCLHTVMMYRLHAVLQRAKCVCMDTYLIT